MRILIIDDDTAHGESLAELIAGRGHETYFAPSLEEARWLLDLFGFTVAIVDFDMPGLNGAEVARRLLELDPNLQVIVMSAHESTPERQQLLAGLPYLTKPLEIDQVLGTLAHLSVQRHGAPLVRRGPFALRPYTGEGG